MNNGNERFRARVEKMFQVEGIAASKHKVEKHIADRETSRVVEGAHGEG